MDANKEVIVNKLANNQKAFGLAIDLGTTTIAICLLDLKTKNITAKTIFKNKQKKFGADVLSRAEKACLGRSKEIQKTVLDDIFINLVSLCDSCSIQIKDIKTIVLVANTIMCHLLLNLPVCGLIQSPFTPYSLRFSPLRATDFFCSVNPKLFFDLKLENLYCNFTVLPCINSFIGSDVLTALAVYTLEPDVYPCLYIDLGTNAEIVLVDKQSIWCTSAAAGPAFEGAHISCGCESIPGAIASVWHEKNTFKYKQIDQEQNEKTIPGICGSGLIDFLAESLELGLVKEDGSLAPICQDSGIILDKNLNFRLTGHDIRELQLAIAAVRTGTMLLLEKAKYTAKSIKKVFVAGVFGFFLNETNAIRVGLFDSHFVGKIDLLGNAALQSCLEYIKKNELKQIIDDILTRCKPIVLADEDMFNKKFIEFLEFPKNEDV